MVRVCATAPALEARARKTIAEGLTLANQADWPMGSVAKTVTMSGRKQVAKPKKEPNKETYLT